MINILHSVGWGMIAAVVAFIVAALPYWPELPPDEEIPSLRFCGGIVFVIVFLLTL